MREQKHPILENGWNPVFKGIFYCLAGLTEVFALVLLQHQIKTKIRYWMLLLTAVILTGLIFGPTYAAISEFGVAEATSLRYPPFEEWRIVTLGYHWSNLDFLAIFQWVAGAFIRISLALFLVVDMFGMRQGKKQVWVLAGLFTLASAFAMIPISDMQFFALLYHILVPGQFIWWAITVAILSIVVWRLSGKAVQPK